MKKWIAGISFVFLVISVCMIVLVRRGMSLRSAPLIKPIPIDASQTTVAHSVMLRLFPEFQSSDYVILGVRPTNVESVQLLDQLRQEYESIFQKKISWLTEGEKATTEELNKCPPPCWVLLPREKANQLTSPNWVEMRLSPLGRPSFTLTWVPYQREEVVSVACEQEKRQSLACLEAVSVREVHKKLKGPGQRYFFMRKYNESDYFLFLEKAIEN